MNAQWGELTGNTQIGCPCGAARCLEMGDLFPAPARCAHREAQAAHSLPRLFESDGPSLLIPHTLRLLQKSVNGSLSCAKRGRKPCQYDQLWRLGRKRKPAPCRGRKQTGKYLAEERRWAAKRSSLVRRIGGKNDPVRACASISGEHPTFRALLLRSLTTSKLELAPPTRRRPTHWSHHQNTRGFGIPVPGY